MREYIACKFANFFAVYLLLQVTFVSFITWSVTLLENCVAEERIIYNLVAIYDS